jgi:tetratricopeptide (TPR) repeat protein
LCTSAVNACLNIFAVDSTGHVHYLEHYFFAEIEFRQDVIARNLKHLEKKFNNKDFSYKNISDYGAYLLMVGRFSDGLKIFRALSSKYNNVYEISANTAVAYELNGNIDSALLWEKHSLALSPGGHSYSEWIHLKILEAKKNLRTDPDWCLKNNVTGIVDSIKLNYRPAFHEDGKGMWILNHFIAQLSERLPFTYNEDKALGKLLLELGDAYQIASIYRSYYCYALANYFYPAITPLTREKMQKIRNNYPRDSVSIEERQMVLKPRESSDKEMLPPDDREVNEFINRIIKRSPITKRKITSIPVEQLITRI